MAGQWLKKEKEIVYENGQVINQQRNEFQRIWNDLNKGETNITEIRKDK